MLTHVARFDRHGASQPLEADRGELPAHLRAARRHGGFLWVESWAPDRAEMDELAEVLGLDRRSAAEAATGRQQPKIQRFDDHLTLVVWTLEFRTVRPRIAIGEVFLFVVPGALLTVRRPRADDSPQESSHLAEPGTAVTGGPLGAAFSIVERVCADYVELTDEIEDELEEIEQQVYDDAVVESRTRIYRLRQQIGKIGRAVSSLTSALEASQEHVEKASMDGQDVRPYVRSILDDLTGTAALLHDQSSTLDAVVASHENNVASRQADDTRKISAIAALLSVPALTAGVFGMNFGDLPLVKTPYGWAYVLAAALVVDAVVFVLFRRRGWL